MLKMLKNQLFENDYLTIIFDGINNSKNYESIKTYCYDFKCGITIIIENEISESKYTKKDSEFDKPKILEDILISVYNNLDDSEKIWLEKQIQHIIDNKLVKKKTLILKGYNLLKKGVIALSKHL